MLGLNGFLIKEECSPIESFVKEVCCERSNPLEDRETSTGLEHEQGNDLLEEESHNDRWPAFSSTNCQR